MLVDLVGNYTRLRDPTHDFDLLSISDRKKGGRNNSCLGQSRSHQWIMLNFPSDAAPWLLLELFPGQMILAST